VIDTGDGPLPYQLLGAWMRLGGPSYRGAAQIQTLLHALLAALLFGWTLRRGWPSVLAVQLALLAAAPLSFGALWAGLTLLVPATLRSRPGLVFGVLLAGLATVEPGWFLVCIAVALTVRSDLLRDGATGLGAGMTLVVLAALASGSPGATLSNALTPWSRLFAEFGRVFDTVQAGAWLHLPFSGLTTGEDLGARWPLHTGLRAFGLRLSVMLLLAAPALLIWRGADKRGLPLALSISAVGLVLLRGDVPGIVTATVLSALAWSIASVGWHRALLALFAVALATPVAENLWLTTHARRAGLELWDSSRVGVRLDAARARGLKTTVSELHLHTDQPALIWPDLPGLHFLLGSRPVVRSLGPGEDAATAAALRASSPPVVLLAPHPTLLPQELERSLPATATELRRNFRLRGALPAGGLNLRAYQRGGSAEDPLVAFFPRVEIMVARGAQELSPALRDDLAIGQSFRFAGDDIRGFAIRLVTSADSVPVRMRARLWERPGVDYNSLLEARTLELVARRNQPMHWVDYPVEDSAGRDLALVFETMETPGADVRFAWHEDASEAGIGDVYPWGNALLDLEPVDADLIILIY
jgi:hypothetical protein